MLRCGMKKKIKKELFKKKRTPMKINEQLDGCSPEKIFLGWVKKEKKIPILISKNVFLDGRQSKDLLGSVQTINYKFKRKIVPKFVLMDSCIFGDDLKTITLLNFN